MATIWRTAWDVLLTVGLVCVVIAGVACVRDWRRGTTDVRDERGRLSPAPAALIAIGTLIAAGSIASLAFR
jgi:hypothetical protein